MSNYLKKFLFTALVCMMPYMNSSLKATDVDDYEESIVCIHKVIVSEDQQDVSLNQSTSSQVVNLEESKISWMSYLSSPVKFIAYRTYEITDFAIKNPKIAAFIGLSYMIHGVAANCSCLCYNQGNPSQKMYAGSFGNNIECLKACYNLYPGQWNIDDGNKCFK